MKGLFYKKLYLYRDDYDKVVGVSLAGPMTWEADETSAIIDATISQRTSSGGMAQARGRTLAGLDNPDPFWVCSANVEGDVAPEEGPAVASAKALVRVGDCTETVEWETQVELV